MMGKTLLILTTAGRLHWLEDAVKTLRDPLDLLVVDDATPKELGIGNFCQQHGIQFITKSKPKGLTDSWNIGFRFFKKAKKYTYCILSNDDVQFPQGFSRELIRALNTKYLLAGPLTNNSGDALHQWIKRFIKDKIDFKDIDKIQKTLMKKYRHDRFQPCSFVNGFCFSFSTSIFPFAFSANCLCNPANINVDNEHDIASRIQQRYGRIAVCKTSYVYHAKMGTYRELGWKKIGGQRNRLWR